MAELKSETENVDVKNKKEWKPKRKFRPWCLVKEGEFQVGPPPLKVVPQVVPGPAADQAELGGHRGISLGLVDPSLMHQLSYNDPDFHVFIDC